MAINPTVEFASSAPQFFNQTYMDLTFVLGPPHGERYEMLVNAARLEEASFSSVYQKYIEAMFTALNSEDILFISTPLAVIWEQKVERQKCFRLYLMRAHVRCF